MNRKTTNGELVEAVFPAEFLDCFAETAFKTLYDYLKKNASKDAALLLDSMYVLMKENSDLERIGKVSPVTNENLIDNVADASRCIVALGGMFYAPSGASNPRER